MPLELPGNHFDLFGAPRALELDAARLEERYRALQRELHPDRHAAAGARERALAAQAAARVNEAYRTLRDRLARAAYLLELRGEAPDAERDAVDDPEFLMRQMEWRERLEELGGAAEAAALGARLDGEEAELWGEFAARYESADWAGARARLNRLRFYRRLQEQLRAARPESAAA